VATDHEREVRERFAERYAAGRTDLVDEIEARVIGAAWGANGYTTVAEADELARRLALGPGRRLLDVGTGRGWPGLYLAASTGCRMIGTDVPVAALSAASARARREGLVGSAAFVAAAGARLPFRAGSFDAVVHTDVLC
jgi:methylase of polypeptide subunit release factors